MEQEHRITYKAGITRNPSDFLCGDGELAECINLSTDSEELKPVVQPAVHIASAVPASGVTIDGIPTFLYIHKFNDEERYIGYTNLNGASQPSLVWGTVNGTVFTMQDGLKKGSAIVGYEAGMKFTSVGKTLVVSGSGGMDYFLWKNGEYGYLGPIPEPKFNFWFSIDNSTKEYDFVENTGSGEGIIDGAFSGSLHTIKLKENQQDAYNDLILGLYGKNKKSIASENGFCEPFFIRYALEMYDGSYYYISNPILLFPCVKRNSYAKINTEFSVLAYLYIKGLVIRTRYSKLFCTQTQDYSDFSDIVKDVVLFASEGISLYDLNQDQPLDNISSSTHTLTDGISSILHQLTKTYPTNDDFEPDSSEFYNLFSVLKRRDVSYIEESIRSNSIFYKLCSIGILPFSNEAANVSAKIQEHVLENLTTQEYLQNDDYFSRCALVPDYIYSYNSRLNLANVKRGFFEGFDYFLPWDFQDVPRTYDIYVTIKTDEGNVVVKHTVPETKQKMGWYFYYPDSRATHVVILSPSGGSNKVLDTDLTEHPGLNGAYYFAGLPTENISPDDTGSGSTSVTPNPMEILPNYIIQSEVNNPWVYQAMGYFKVGTGRIIGMSTITQALSQGQFGQYPLLVFSESGIWALSVGSEGYYMTINPMSRDVCINKNSIIQTDGAVFFVSKKGLMVVAGGDVNCVSGRMNGATFDTSVLTGIAGDTDWEDIVEACQDSTSFLDYIRNENLIMAYDYIDSRIVMTKPGAGYSFVYNMADGTISKVILPAAMTGAVNNYPDYLMQGTVWEQGGTPLDPVMMMKKKVFSFYGKQREEEVADRQLGFLLTRPMKLAGPVSKTSLRQLMNVGMWNKAEGSAVKTEIYLSDDLQTWYPDISRFGAAAKYYRLALYVKMLPTERLSGTILTEQPRRTNNFR